MKVSGRWILIFIFGLLAPILLFSGAGCQTTKTQAGPADQADTTNAPPPQVEILRVGELLKIDFSGGPTLIPVHEEHIKGDGTISLDLVGTVKAAGKTTGDLQKELNLRYKEFYKNLNVTVRTQDRFYFVGGEVKKEDRQLYLGPTTVTRAIQSAGGFTDYANRRKIRVVRESGKIEIIDWRKAIRDSKLDPPIYPGDSIHVDRTLWR